MKKLLGRLHTYPPGSWEGGSLRQGRAPDNLQHVFQLANSLHGMIYASEEDWNKSRLLTGRCLPSTGHWSIRDWVLSS